MFVYTSPTTFSNPILNRSVAAFSFTDDFSGADNWSDADSAKIGVNTTNDNLDFNFVADSTNDSCSYDIGTANISNTWSLRYKTNFSSFSGTSIRWWIGVSDSSSSASHSTSQEFIGFMGIGDCSGNAGSQDADGAALPTGSWDTNAAQTLSTSTNYWWTINRINSTSYEVKLYSDAYTTLVRTWSGTCNSTLNSLRYIVLRNENDSRSNGVVGVMDDVDFLDGSTR